MKKILFSTLIAFSLTACFSNADETKKLSDEELIAKIMQLEKQEQEADKRISEAKAKTKALEKLEKTVDKLGKTLQVDK